LDYLDDRRCKEGFWKFPPKFPTNEARDTTALFRVHELLVRKFEIFIGPEELSGTDSYCVWDVRIACFEATGDNICMFLPLSLAQT
jgi:hypothetical protein